MKVFTQRKTTGNRLTAMMMVRNEAGRHLELVLRELSDFVDDIVIVDDASDDETVSICRDCQKVSLVLEGETSQFKEEWALRSRLWQAAAAENPDWLLSVDADEVYESSAKAAIRSLIDQSDYDWVGFRFFDFWGDFQHYREDRWWNIHQRHTMTLVRYLPGFHYFYPRMDHHVPRLPLSCQALPGHLTDLRVKHYGWVGTRADLEQKYRRYLEADPEGRWGSREHYESILDPAPNLLEWKEDEPWHG